MQKDFSKINVLVVDDMATAREYISKQLRDIGVINISTASSIVDAFKKINDRIHLIICDYYLGDGRNGKDFIEELRKEEKISDSVVCIMVTAEARFESVIGSAENGIDGYFLKPWNPEDFFFYNRENYRKKGSIDSNIYCYRKKRVQEGTSDM